MLGNILSYRIKIITNATSDVNSSEWLFVLECALNFWFPAISLLSIEINKFYNMQYVICEIGKIPPLLTRYKFQEFIQCAPNIRSYMNSTPWKMSVKQFNYFKLFFSLLAEWCLILCAQNTHTHTNSTRYQSK